MADQPKVELSDDWRTDEPLAWVVKCQPDAIEEYRVFTDEREAKWFAEVNAINAGEDWPVYPLYAGVPA